MQRNELLYLQIFRSRRAGTASTCWGNLVLSLGPSSLLVVCILKLLGDSGTSLSVTPWFPLGHDLHLVILSQELCRQSVGRMEVMRRWRCPERPYSTQYSSLSCSLNVPQNLGMALDPPNGGAQFYIIPFSFSVTYYGKYFPDVVDF